MTDGTSARLAAAAALHSKMFVTDPVLNFLLHSMDPVKFKSYFPTYMYVLLKAGALNGATFDEAWTSSTPPPANAAPDDPTPPACSAVWVPPGRKVDDWRYFVPAGMVGMLFNVGLGACKRMLGDYQSRAHAAKRKGLSRQDGKGLVDFYYLFFISTKVEERGKGLSSALIRRFQGKVRAEGKGRVLWLESTTENSRKLYEKCGFTIVDSWVLGKGVVDKDGKTKKGGEGLRVWAMVWKLDEKQT